MTAGERSKDGAGYLEVGRGEGISAVACLLAWRYAALLCCSIDDKEAGVLVWAIEWSASRDVMVRLRLRFSCHSCHCCRRGRLLQRLVCLGLGTVDADADVGVAVDYTARGTVLPAIPYLLSDLLETRMQEEGQGIVYNSGLLGAVRSLGFTESRCLARARLYPLLVVR